MAKKQYFLILGSKVTVDGTVADLGAIVVDRKGKIYEEYPNSFTKQLDVNVAVQAVTSWLDSVYIAYKPSLTAYRLAIELDNLAKTGIDISQFTDKFCLWHLAAGHFADTKAYKRFVLNNHAFTDPVNLGHMSYRTDAAVMAAFLQGWSRIPDEAHTALGDCKGWKLPIFVAVLKRPQWRATKLKISTNYFTPGARLTR